MRNHSLELGLMVQKECRLKVILIWSSGRFCSVEHNHLCKFGKGYYEEQFCEIILNLGQWFWRCPFKDFLSGALAALLFSGTKPFMQF